MNDCVFCAITGGELDASVVHEDDATIAFVDIRQFQIGHTLVVPKRHIENIYELDDETGAALTRTLVRVARAVRQAFTPDGLNIWQSNGDSAGQEVFHLHFHVLPRTQHDGMLQFYPSRPGYPSRTELDVQAARIRSDLPA